MRLDGTRRAFLLPALLAAAAGIGGVFLAAHHPLWPVAAVVSFLAWCVLSARVPLLWLAVVPAVLPLMNFSPWTGWIVFDELDLAVLGALAGGHARAALAMRRADRAANDTLPHGIHPLALPWLALGVLGLAQGLAASGGAGFGWFDGETDPLNAWRVFKGPFYALLAMPLLRPRPDRDPDDVIALLGAGMLAGAAIVVGASVWERAAYPGLLDFASDYRIVALFWEMHVGGAAIDVYLAMAAPFVAHAVTRAGTPARWILAATLAVLFEYTCLTTYSRGVYVAVPAGLLVFALLRRRAATDLDPPRRRTARRALMVVLALEALAIVGSDSFMLMRARRTPEDFGSRLAHWRHGIDLLHGPLQWSLGRGLGTFPAAYADAVPDHELSGQAHVTASARDAWLTLRGPARDARLAGWHALTQRLRSVSSDGYRVQVDVRADRSTRLGFFVCEIHLVHEGACQHGDVVVPGGAGWQHLSIALQGDRLATGGGLSRSASFGITVLDTGRSVDIARVRLEHDGDDLLRNAEFAHGLAAWFPSARHYFVPWHIDSLPLELLIEQGIAGLAAFVLLFGTALRAALSPRNRGLSGMPVLVGSMLAALLIGLVSSVLDVPRVAFLLFLFAFIVLQYDRACRAGR